MEREQLRSILDRHIKKVQELVDSIVEHGGVPIDSNERRLIREVVSCSWLPEMMDKAKMFLAMGSIKDADEAFKNIIRTFEDLT